MSLARYLFITFTLALLVSAHLGDQLPTQDLSPKVHCGRSLARIIAHLCYDYPRVDRQRSEDGTIYGALITPYYNEQDNIGWPWMSPKVSALGSIHGKHFTSGGVADKCCEKPCSVRELLNYC